MIMRELPIEMDAEKIAEGLLEMFTEEERVALQFGMLPAKMMEILEKQIRTRLRKTLKITGSDDIQCATLKGSLNPKIIRKFSVNGLISECLCEICLALFKIGDLVV